MKIRDHAGAAWTNKITGNFAVYGWCASFFGATVQWGLGAGIMVAGILVCLGGVAFGIAAVFETDT